MSDIAGMDELIEYLGTLPTQLQSKTAAAMDRELGRAVTLAKRKASAGEDPDHEVTRSITHTVSIGGEGVEGQLVANHERAIYREIGTGPRGYASGGKPPIPAKYTLQTMIKTGRRAGTIIPGWVYHNRKAGHLVHSMGQPAQPFLYPAWEESEQLVTDAVEAAIDRMLEGGG